MITLLLFCWVIGYFANAIWNTKFELSSCWAGISAISAAGLIKFVTDSVFNSTRGEHPYEGDKPGNHKADV